MVSGNFLIGDDLSLVGFNQYVRPLFEKMKYSVQDTLIISDASFHKKILLSVVGEGFLERTLNSILVESGEAMDEERLIKLKSDVNYTPVAYNHQISTFSHSIKGEDEKRIIVNKGLYFTIGIYNADDTASKLFPSIAQEYLLIGVKTKANELERQIRNLLGKKLSEL